MRFTINGQIRDSAGRALDGLFVEAFEWGVYGDYDCVGKTKTAKDGKYKITFSEAESRYPLRTRDLQRYICLVISDEHYTLLKNESTYTMINSDVPTAHDIIINLGSPPDEIYKNSQTRMLMTFTSVADTISPSKLGDIDDIGKRFGQLARVIERFCLYTRPEIIRQCGYRGPYVPDDPAGIPHEEIDPLIYRGRS